jgi:hypothetical protein
MSDEIYGDERAKRLVELLRALAARIAALGSDADLLAAGPELIKLMGDARSELFHYEVRATYDTPEAAESRRIVEEARRRMDGLEYGRIEFDRDEAEGDEPWRRRT